MEPLQEKVVSLANCSTCAVMGAITASKLPHLKKTKGKQNKRNKNFASKNFLRVLSLLKNGREKTCVPAERYEGRMHPLQHNICCRLLLPPDFFHKRFFVFSSHTRIELRAGILHVTPHLSQLSRIAFALIFWRVLTLCFSPRMPTWSSSPITGSTPRGQAANRSHSGEESLLLSVTRHIVKIH